MRWHRLPMRHCGGQGVHISDSLGRANTSLLHHQLQPSLCSTSPLTPHCCGWVAQLRAEEASSKLMEVVGVVQREAGCRKCLSTLCGNIEKLRREDKCGGVEHNTMWIIMNWASLSFLLFMFSLSVVHTQTKPAAPRAPLHIDRNASRCPCDDFRLYITKQTLVTTRKH